MSHSQCFINISKYYRYSVVIPPPNRQLELEAGDRAEEKPRGRLEAEQAKDNSGQQTGLSPHFLKTLVLKCLQILSL